MLHNNINPFVTTICTFNFILRNLLWLCNVSSNIILPRFIILCLASICWTADIFLESINGEYNETIIDGFKLGFLIFIFREVILFVSLFWRFFHSSIVPNGEIGLTWLYESNNINPLTVPLLNTIILLSRGVTVTIAHHLAILNEDIWYWIKRTILLGVYFRAIQLIEYKTRTFTIRDGVTGRIFFTLTGLHGIHVLLGSLGLSVANLRGIFIQTSNLNHIFLERVIIYWHFVDVVWLFLYCTIYYWPS